MSTAYRRCFWAVVIMAGVACGDATGPAPIDRVVVQAGDAQTGTAGGVLSEPVVAQVFREDGTEAEFVLFVQLVGPGAIDLGGAEAAGAGATVLAPDRGTAIAVWTLGEAVGEQRLRFFVVPARGDTIETFATAQAVAPR